jgi:predicted  nucleic acid-binding Zn-ribbon protein
VLKKKISDLEKKRKELSGQMEDDSKELASALKDAGGKLQEALEERFSDIAANMTFAFKEHQL